MSEKSPADAYKALIRRLIETVQTQFPLEVCAPPIVAFDIEGEGEPHLQMLFAIDSERLGKSAEELAEQAQYDEQFSALTNSLNQQIYEEKLKEQDDQIKENLKKFLDG